MSEKLSRRLEELDQVWSSLCFCTWSPFLVIYMENLVITKPNVFILCVCVFFFLAFFGIAVCIIAVTVSVCNQENVILILCFV